jgi:hypothetical protein
MSKDTSKSQGKKMLIVNLELGEGEQENILIYENDNVRKISIEFCKKKCLDEEFVSVIEEHILKSLEWNEKTLSNKNSESMIGE